MSSPAASHLVRRVLDPRLSAMPTPFCRARRKKIQALFSATCRPKPRAHFLGARPSSDDERSICVSFGRSLRRGNPAA